MEEDKPKTCVFFGASVIDLISYVDRFPVPGETLSGNNFRKGTGGKAANACVMAARLGLSCRILTKIGYDSFGEEMLKNFEAHNISRDFVYLTRDACTATASITVTRKGENNIIYVPGATNLLTPDEITAVSDNLFAGCSLFVSTFECVPASLHAALLAARKHGVATLVNGAPPFPKPMENSHIYALCDILCVNETEAQLMTKLSVDTLEDCRIACKMILDKGCGSVILTMGENGALYVSRSGQALHIPVPHKITPVDTTGAGDSFMGALAYYLVHYPHLTIDEQIRRCNIIASATVLRPGTQDSYPQRDELPADIFN